MILLARPKSHAWPAGIGERREMSSAARDEVAGSRSRHCRRYRAKSQKPMQRQCRVVPRRGADRGRGAERSGQAFAKLRLSSTDAAISHRMRPGHISRRLDGARICAAADKRISVLTVAPSPILKSHAVRLKTYSAVSHIAEERIAGHPRA